jgi:DNA-binding transcriptional MerR regulator/methylmalonyl-CoA mutase cobalamin-binding subunit
MTQRFEVPRHPIGVAAERTGLSTDVIRVWERRYGVVEPARSEADQRLYSDADVERLRLLRRATEGGRSIGQVAALAPEALAELVREDEAGRWKPEEREPGMPAVEELVELAKSLDGVGLEAALRRSLLATGLAGFGEGVAAPLLRRIGDGWHAGEVTPAQEHLASVAVRRVLESVGGGGEGGPTAVVATLSEERHEAGALLAAAAAELAGWRVVYLGADLPPADLAAAATSAGARAVCASVVYAPDPAEVVARFRELRARLPDGVEVYAGGGAAGELRETLERFGIRCPADIGALREALEAGAGVDG